MSMSFSRGTLENTIIPVHERSVALIHSGGPKILKLVVITWTELLEQV